MQVSRPLLGEPRLTIARRDKTNLIDGLDGQVKLVRELLAGSTPGVPILGGLCFVDAELPLIGKLTPGCIARRLLSGCRLAAAGSLLEAAVRWNPLVAERGSLPKDVKERSNT